MLITIPPFELDVDLLREQRDWLLAIHNRQADGLINLCDYLLDVAEDALPSASSSDGTQNTFCIVGVTATCERLAVCATVDQASEYIGTLPNAEKGVYYIDECSDTVEIGRPIPDRTNEETVVTVVEAAELAAARSDPRVRSFLDEADAYLVELEQQGRNS